MLNVLYSVPKMGAAQQYSTDNAEKLHVELKTAYRRTNRKKFEEQIYRMLDRDERLQLFESSHAVEVSLTDADDEQDDPPHSSESTPNQWLLQKRTVYGM